MPELWSEPDTEEEYSILHLIAEIISSLLSFLIGCSLIVFYLIFVGYLVYIFLSFLSGK